ncbi:TNF receptor-associated factor 6 isoform X2 [Hemicordylus capensis]|uniref:TNF receptor-associated factor 6 isoform X2 n=1 Tax=Hemicordylus capensis TaxID=884348 RepID=UPI0023030FDC|nr:TNF receptor-associated factor 6 isoform X2 [Hemicordylus capensis]
MLGPGEGEVAAAYARRRVRERRRRSRGHGQRWRWPRRGNWRRECGDAGHKCPIDNEILLEKQLFPDNFAKREILSLTVKCPNGGCTQKMELRHLEDHQLHCGFALEKCPQCQADFHKNQLQEHIEHTCPWRQVSCPNCALCMPYEEKELHDQSCLLANVFCEYCNTELIRGQLPNHYDNDCPTAPVPCTYSDFGCPERMQRNELARHMQEYTQVHMRMMAQHFRSIRVATPTCVPCDPSHFPSSCECSPEVQNFKETIQHLEGRLVKQDHQIRELTAKMETQNTHMGDLKRVVRNLEEKLAEVEAQQCNGIFIWKIENFSIYLKAQEEEKPVVIHSTGFYTGKPGYKLCLRLHIQLPTAQRCANYISLFVHMMQGDYDSHLPWPFQGTIRLSILDQSEGPLRHNHEEIMDTKPELLAFQRPVTHRSPKGFGYVTFMQLQALKQRTYIKGDTLLIRCEVVTRLDLSSLRREGFQPRSTDGST